MSTSELNPGEQINRLLRSWWVIVVSMLVCGAAGYLVHSLRPPIYEATTTFNVWLDFNYLKTDREFTEYDEDLSINTVGDSYVSPKVLQQVTDEGLKQGWIQSPDEVYLNYRLERNHSGWELRFQSTDPENAMKMANYWATVGYQYLLDLENSGTFPTYVRFSEPVMAILPTRPVRFGLNNLILAGSMLGLVAGILLSGWMTRKGK